MATESSEYPLNVQEGPGSSLAEVLLRVVHVLGVKLKITWKLHMTSWIRGPWIRHNGLTSTLRSSYSQKSVTFVSCGRSPGIFSTKSTISQTMWPCCGIKSCLLPVHGSVDKNTDLHHNSLAGAVRPCWRVRIVEEPTDVEEHRICSNKHAPKKLHAALLWS